jgi:hypothetical protein
LTRLPSAATNRAHAEAAASSRSAAAGDRCPCPARAVQVAFRSFVSLVISVAYRFHYRDSGRTLQSGEVDAAHQRMLEMLTQKLGVKFR